MKIAFVIDPIATFNPHAETTFFLMREMTRRGWDVYGVELKDLILENGAVLANAQKLIVTWKDPPAFSPPLSKGGLGGSPKQFTYKILSTEKLNLAKMDAIFLRKDPPVDLTFIDHLSILELLRGKTLLVNNPLGIKHANEKIFPFHFQNISPKTLVTKNHNEILRFIQKNKGAILKPLNLSGGRGIVKVSHKDPSLSSLIDILTNESRHFIMAQEFLPAAIKGDKRILLLDGEILGCFLRVPTKTDFRGNLHSGARLKKSILNSREKKLVHSLKPELQKLGLYFVGLDLIGGFITEINVTSPMGLGELNALFDIQSEKFVVDWLFGKITKTQKLGKFL